MAKIRSNMANLDRLFPPPMPPNTKPLPLRQPDTSLLPSAPFPTALLESPKRELIDHATLQAQIRANMAKLDWLFPLPMPTMLMHLPLRQLDSPLTTPTPSSTTLNKTTKHKPFDITNNNPHPLDPMQLPTQMTTQQSAYDHLELPTEPLATLTLLPVVLSQIGRLLDNIHTPNTSIWMPDTLHRCHTAN